MKKGSILLIILASLAVITLYIFNVFSLYSQSIRLDESQSIWISSKPITSILKIVSQDVHVPLYSILLHFWIQLFGNDIVFARSLSLIFFILTIPCLYLMTKESSSKRVALLTVVLFSVSPFILWYTSEARMYTLFTFITSINHLFFLRFYKSKGEKSKLPLIITTVLGFYTHYFFIFLIITQFLFLLLRLWIESLGDKEYEQKSLMRLLWNRSDIITKYIFIVSIALIFFTPWVTYVVSQGSISNTKPLIPPPTSYNVIVTFINFIFGFQSQTIQSILVSLWPLSIILLFLVFTQKRKLVTDSLEYFFLATFLPIILVFFASYIRPLFLSRYLILVTPTLFFILAWIMLSYSKKVTTYIVTFFLVTMLALMYYQTASAKTPVKEDYKGVTQVLETQATPFDIIGVSAPFTVYPIEYNYHGHSRIVTVPFWDRYATGAIPSYSDEELKKQIDGYKKTYDRIFLVLSYDQGYESKIKKYLDTHLELLKTQTFSPGLQLRVYKLRYE